MKQTKPIVVTFSDCSQTLTFLASLFMVLLINSCNLTTSGPQVLNASNPETTGASKCEETVMFYGSPGAGKSSLCNSIFQKDVFKSGVSIGEGLTKAKQAYVYENRKYIDTPGLSDVKLRKRAAKEIEAALKENSNYKIVFVVAIEAGRVRPDDLEMINAVCDAIDTPFEYGIIVNKVNKWTLTRFNQNRGALVQAFLPTLHKAPSSYAVITVDEDMEDADNVFLSADSHNRMELLDFINHLKPNNPNEIAPKETQEAAIQNYEKEESGGSYEEAVIFCGNPGVGKSTLCNSIFQKAAFQAGVSFGKGMTQQQQAFIYHNTKYVDTPGLSDVASMEQAAQEIEKALKENNNYKVVFVATLAAGRINSEDLATINKICESIKVDFEYGIIFNKVTKPMIALLQENQAEMKKYLANLHKQPTSIAMLEKDRTIADKNNMFFSANSENRGRLLDFIASLKTNIISASQVRPVDVADKKAQSEKLSEKLARKREKFIARQQEKERLEIELQRAKAEEREREMKRERAAYIRSPWFPEKNVIFSGTINECAVM
jgi:GTP-binding protein EngB required for normal cell division